MRTAFVFLAASFGAALACSSESPSSEETHSGDGDEAGSGGTGLGGAGTGGEETAGTGGAEDGTGGGPLPQARPQLSVEDAANYTVLDFLATRGSVVSPIEDNWDPTDGLGPVEAFPADYTVAASGGTHTTVQSAIDAAIAAAGSERVYIAIEPGEYRELVCIGSSVPPITLYGTGTGPEDTTLVYDNYAGKAKTEEDVGNPCAASTGKDTYGTSGSSSVVSVAAGFQAKNLTFANDTNEAEASGAIQAVALLVQGDQTILENVRILGNQDTFYAKGTNQAIAVRMFVKDSYIEGDTDFVFGHARIVITGSTLHVVGDRKSNGVLVAPSTHALNEYGILIDNSTITADENVTQVHLGRAWDESQGTLEAYIMNVASGDYPNGMAVVRNCTIDAPVGVSAWTAAATTGRPFSSVPVGNVPANRLYEFENVGSGSAP